MIYIIQQLISCKLISITKISISFLQTCPPRFDGAVRCASLFTWQRLTSKPVTSDLWGWWVLELLGTRWKLHELIRKLHPPYPQNMGRVCTQRITGGFEHCIPCSRIYSYHASVYIPMHFKLCIVNHSNHSTPFLHSRFG